jgi:hypothetical protein
MTSLERCVGSAATGASGYVPLPWQALCEERTGQAAIPSELFALEGQFTVGPLARRPRDCSCYAFQSALLSVLSQSRRPFQTGTSYGMTVSLDAHAFLGFMTDESTKWSTVFVKPHRGSGLSIEEVTPVTRLGSSRARNAITAAEELRSFTKLPSITLANMFGVSRTTFYNWIEGSTPRDERFQHLVDALAHVKDASRKLPSTIDLSLWLRTPIASGAKTPLDYLREKRFRVFRGLLVRVGSEAMGLTPVMSVLSGPTMSREERAAALERISPQPRSDEED